MSESRVSAPGVLWGFTTQCDDALIEAAGRLDVALVGERRYGLAGKSAGAAVADRSRSRRWLRVTGLVGAKINARRRAEIGAESLRNLPKPDVHRAIEWERDGVHWRAVLSALAPSPTLSEHPWLTADAAMPPESWFHDLRAGLLRLQSAPTVDDVVTDEQISIGIQGHFGPDAPRVANEWCACHGDLHWNNLTAPRLALLDWENWGRAPRGYDVARLIVYAALVPQMQRKLYAAFADQLDSPTGCVVLLYALGMVKANIEGGVADQALADPLERMTRVLLATRRVGACLR